MEKEIIQAPKTANYLAEFMTELPVNCLFDKGRTGCGGTTIAIENEKDTIIAMPYVSVIKNKEDQHENLLGIFQGVTDEEIIDYLKTHQIKKIAVTYDKLEYLIGLLIELGFNPYKDFNLLVDEWHILFNSYAFRNEAVKKVLWQSRKFERVTYMTATPIEEEFILEELKDFPVKEVVWSNTVNVNIKPIVTNRPINAVCNLIKQRLNDKLLGNLHFFVNSVDFISQVINKAELKPDQVRVICSDNKSPGKGRKPNQKKLGDNYKIASTLDEVKPINFYTSTCFEGCDIYDENGRTIIVSDKSKSHTLLDIGTLIIQICGRIRESKYKTQAHHIYSETRYRNFVSLDEFKAHSEKQIQETKDWLNELNNMGETNRKKTIQLIEKGNKSGLNEMYIFKQDDKLSLDENLVKLDIVNFKITKQLYSSRVTLSEEYAKYGFKVVETQKIVYSDKLAANPKARISFKDMFIEYAKIKSRIPKFFFGNIDERISLIEQEKPLVKEAYEVLGVEQVELLKYNVSNIKRKLISKSVDNSIDSKIVKCLSEQGVTSGTIKTAKEWKAIIQDIYIDLDIKQSYNKVKTAKATDLQQWFEIKQTTPKIDGKTKTCYTIIRQKMLYI
ncbi:MAG: hypothetical protein JXR48_18110 [Candidatus Delongbacteria bacterium]|nr:hypothetical protein [Candidatus Delongbacteria bacterium]